jgi:hypothetical protein
LLLGVYRRSLHLDDSGLLEDDTIFTLSLVVLIDHFTIRASLKGLAWNLGIAVDAAQNTVGEVPRRRTATGRCSRPVVHLFAQGSKTV